MQRHNAAGKLFSLCGGVLKFNLSCYDFIKYYIQIRITNNDKLNNYYFQQTRAASLHYFMNRHNSSYS